MWSYRCQSLSGRLFHVGRQQERIGIALDYNPETRFIYVASFISPDLGLRRGAELSKPSPISKSGMIVIPCPTLSGFFSARFWTSFITLSEFLPISNTFSFPLSCHVLISVYSDAKLDVMINSIRGVPGTVKIGGTTSNSLPYIELENKIQGICCGYREKKGGELIVQRPR